MLKECTCGSMKALHAEIARLNKVKAEERVKEMEEKLAAVAAAVSDATTEQMSSEVLAKKRANSQVGSLFGPIKIPPCHRIGTSDGRVEKTARKRNVYAREVQDLQSKAQLEKELDGWRKKSKRWTK